MNSFSRSAKCHPQCAPSATARTGAFLECTASDGLGLAGIEVLKEASSGAITAIDLLTLGLELNDHLRLPAFLVLSEIGIEILHQRKNKKKVNLQSMAAKIQNTASSLNVLKSHLNTDSVVSDWIQRFFSHKVVNNDLASIFDGLRSPSVPHHPLPMLPSASQMPSPSSPSASPSRTGSSPCRSGPSPLSTSPPSQSSAPSSMQKKSTLYHSC